MTGRLCLYTLIFNPRTNDGAGAGVHTMKVAHGQQEISTTLTLMIPQEKDHRKYCRTTYLLYVFQVILRTFIDIYIIYPHILFTSFRYLHLLIDI